MWNHYQPHLSQTKEQLVKLMKQNYDFAAVSRRSLLYNVQVELLATQILGHVVKMLFAGFKSIILGTVWKETYACNITMAQ